ncbi:unnamed protein product [Urochloa humidicola]
MPIYVLREQPKARPRDNNPGRPAFTNSPADAEDQEVPWPAIRCVAVAARGKEAKPWDSHAPSDRRIFVPGEEDKVRVKPSPISSPAAATPPDSVFCSGSNIATTAASPSPRETNPRRLASTAPSAYPTPNKTATTSLARSVGSNNATKDDSEKDLPTAVAAREGEARPDSAAPPTAPTWQSPAAAQATGGVGNMDSASTSLEDVARRDDANASRPILTAPAMAARPRPAAQAMPAPGGSSGTSTAPGENLHKEETFCERLLPCFGLCS